MSPSRSAALRWLARPALAALGLCVALGMAEGLVRALGLAPELGVLTVSSPAGEFVSSPDPVLRYVPRPGAPDINRLGLRDRERQVARAPGTPRVVLLGDSVAYGFCDGRGPLPVDALLNARLEERLGVEVINLGVSGYNAWQEVRMMRVRGLAFDPDLVLVAAVANDVGDASMELEALMALPGWAEERALARWMHGRVTFNSHLLLWLAALRARPDAADPGAGRIEAAYRALARMGEAEGFAVRLALFPDRAARFDAPSHERVLRAAAEAGLPAFDLAPHLLGQEALYAPCSAMHPNARGHALAAERLAPFVAEGLGSPP